MTKNGIFLSILAVILAVCYVRYFTDWFRTHTIQIVQVLRPSRAMTNPKTTEEERVHDVAFNFDSRYQLTAVKVVSASDMATNNYPVPLWHLVSESNSAPVKSITYGYPISGMKPAVPRARAEPLTAGIDYVLLLEAGKIRARTNFQTSRVAVK